MKKTNLSFLRPKPPPLSKTKPSRSRHSFLNVLGRSEEDAEHDYEPNPSPSPSTPAFIRAFFAGGGGGSLDRDNRENKVRRSPNPSPHYPRSASQVTLTSMVQRSPSNDSLLSFHSAQSSPSPSSNANLLLPHSQSFSGRLDGMRQSFRKSMRKMFSPVPKNSEEG
jgi:hypothetical protein